MGTLTVNILDSYTCEALENVLGSLKYDKKHDILHFDKLTLKPYENNGPKMSVIKVEDIEGDKTQQGYYYMTAETWQKYNVYRISKGKQFLGLSRDEWFKKLDQELKDRFGYSDAQIEDIGIEDLCYADGYDGMVNGDWSFNDWVNYFEDYRDHIEYIQNELGVTDNRHIQYWDSLA